VCFGQLNKFLFYLGGQIHDSHASFYHQYYDSVPIPLNLVLVCGINNIPTVDTSRGIVSQYKSFLKTFRQHHKRNRSGLLFQYNAIQ